MTKNFMPVINFLLLISKFTLLCLLCGNKGGLGKCFTSDIWYDVLLVKGAGETRKEFPFPVSCYLQSMGCTARGSCKCSFLHCLAPAEGSSPSSQFWNHRATSSAQLLEASLSTLSKCCATGKAPDCEPFLPAPLR